MMMLLRNYVDDRSIEPTRPLFPALISESEKENARPRQIRGCNLLVPTEKLSYPPSPMQNQMASRD